MTFSTIAFRTRIFPTTLKYKISQRKTFFLRTFPLAYPFPSPLAHIETKGKRDNLSEKEIDAIYNLPRLLAIFLVDNLWAEAKAIVKIRMSDDAVCEWILLRGGRFDVDGVFLNVNH